MSIVNITRNGRPTRFIIDTVFNQAYTDSLKDLPHIVEAAYKQGIWAFYNGSKTDLLPKAVRALIIEREEARKERKLRRVAEINALVNDMYPTAEDAFGLTELLSENNGYHVTLASNPFTDGTLYAKEWQRGFDTGYNRTRKKNGTPA